MWRLLDTTEGHKQRLGVTSPRMKCRKALGNRGPVGPGIRAASDAVDSARPRPSTLLGRPGSWRPWGWTPSRGSPGNPALRGREGTVLRSRWSPREVRAQLLCAGRDRTDAHTPHSGLGSKPCSLPGAHRRRGRRARNAKSGGAEVEGYLVSFRQEPPGRQQEGCRSPRTSEAQLTEGHWGGRARQTRQARAWWQQGQVPVCQSKDRRSCSRPQV